MKEKRYLNFIYILLLLLLTVNPCNSEIWQNDLRNLFGNNQAVIYALNIRTFGANDLNGDEIIDINYGETRGSFLNAIDRLEELKELGINTIHMLPITKTGKLKALGTLGSLYAMDSFDKISPQLDDLDNPLDVYEEAKIFINEAHKKNFRIIIDLPSCASYDMTLEKPSLFLRNKNDQAIVPSDWTDVRLFKTLNGNKLNSELLDNYKKFIDMAKELNVDGIRADVASIKPKEFWAEIIRYAREGNPQMLFLAEASPSWNNPIKPYSGYLSVQELLAVGFDGYYGEYMNFLENKNNSDFIRQQKKEYKILKKFNKTKSTIASFATHDNLSPNINEDTSYSKMIVWLATTLETNPYYLDGFQTGDTYIYGYENKKADKTSTDDDYYFVHRGKFDIFNQSRRPGGKYPEIKEEMIKAKRFREWGSDILQNGSVKYLKTSDENILAYERKYKNTKVIVICNLNFSGNESTKLNIRGLKKSKNFTPLKEVKDLTVKNNSLIFNLDKGEVGVYIFSQNK